MPRHNSLISSPNSTSPEEQDVSQVPESSISFRTRPTKQERMEFCPACGRGYPMIITSKAVGLCPRCKDTAKRLAARIAITEYLGAKCSVCGRKVESIEDISLFDVHHCDPEHKEFEYADNPECISMAGKLRDLARCALTCAACHRKRHNADHHARVIIEAERQASNLLAKMDAQMPRPNNRA